MEKVLHWRLCKGDRSCVPKPFRPTALQSSQAKPQLAVDFLNWPDIRDQLLLNMASIDLDTLTRDIVLNTVIEVPQRNVAINVFDLFQNGILNGGPRPACNLFDPNWVYFEITVFDEDFDASAADPVEEAIIRELARRVHRFTATSALTQNREPDFELGGPAGTDAGQMETPLGQVDQRFRKNGLAAVLGLGNASAWKLSKEFAQGYPFLDCSSGKNPSSRALRSMFLPLPSLLPPYGLPSVTDPFFSHNLPQLYRSLRCALSSPTFRRGYKGLHENWARAVFMHRVLRILSTSITLEPSIPQQVFYCPISRSPCTTEDH
jgi:hypothetical protein